MMITRGHFIGEIIDNLSDISQQVELRCSLGLTDMTVYLENFYRDILNEVYGWNLRNLNSERSNEPGLDLGDSTNKVAIQVTANKKKKKIEDTLTTITNEQRRSYSRFIVLIASRKQGSYSDIKNPGNVPFDKEADIWDIDDICRKIVELKIDELESLHKLVRANTVRVKVELEMPDGEGRFPTNIADYMEETPSLKLGNMEAIDRHFARIYEVENDPQNYLEAVEEFAFRLSKLARITREFYLQLLREIEDIDNAKDAKEYRQGLRYSINYLTFRRKCRYPDLDEELLILTNAGLAWHTPTDYDVFEGELPRPAMIRIASGYFAGHPNLLQELLIFADEADISWEKFIIKLDFSDF